MFAFEKLKWYETPGFNMAVLGLFVLVFLSMILAAPIRAIRNRRLSADPKPRLRGAYWIILGICVLNLLFIVGTYLWINPKPVYGVSTIYQIVLGLGVLTALLTAGALVYTVLAWKNTYWGTVTRAYYTLVTATAVGFVWFLNNWNLLGWQF